MLSRVLRAGGAVPRQRQGLLHAVRRCHTSGALPSSLTNVFESRTTFEVLRSVCLFQFVGFPWLMKPMQKALLAATSAEGLFKLPAGALLLIAKKTVFRHFCAGETLADCKMLSESLAQANVRLIVDHSTEEMEDEEAWTDNLENKKRLLRELKANLGHSAVFIPIKVTALASPRLLEAMSTIIQTNTSWAHESPNAQEICDQLGANERRLFESAMENLSELCSQAQLSGIPLLFDAEQSHRQPAIDLMSCELMERFNKPGSAPTVYNTFQMYLRESLERLRRDLTFADERGFVFAAKLVRGAYLTTEEARAREFGLPSPILPSKQHTDEQYDAAVRMIIDRISPASVAGSSPAVVVATHNSASIDRAMKAMAEHSLPAAHPHVHMAQIMGMCDGLTLRQGLSGHNSLKLVLFGDFHHIFPWLLRRMDENMDMLGGAQMELPALKLELRRRFGLARRHAGKLSL